MVPVYANRLRKRRPAGQRAHQTASEALVDEETCVEVVVQVHEVGEVVLLDADELAARGAALVLRRPALATAFLEDDVLRRQVEHGADHAERVLEPPPDLGEVDLGRRRVLLHVHPVAVHVDDHVEVRQVGVVEAVAGDALAAQLLAEPPLVLDETVGELLRAGAEHPGVRRRALARASGRRPGRREAGRLVGRALPSCRAGLGRRARQGCRAGLGRPPGRLSGALAR